MKDVTHVLAQIEQGDPSAADQLLPLVYVELRRLAAAKMTHESPDHTLQATALVHEAYVRLVDTDRTRHWDSRRHFFAAAAEAMRRILVERARKTGRRDKIRGPRIPLDEFNCAMTLPQDQLLGLDEALEKLESQHAAAANIVKLRFFGGLTLEQAAHALGVSVRTANRHWTYARTWLHRELDESAV